MSGPTLKATDLHYGYRGKAVLRGASMHLGCGEVVALLGANGAGKSTLLRLLLGLLRPATGLIELAGRPLSGFGRRELAREMAYVPQTHSTPFPYTVRQVVTMGRLPCQGLFAAPDAEDRRAVDQVLERLAITRLAERCYTEISGGERQLALIARALAQGSRLLIMDEPMSGLDFGHQVTLLQLLRSLADDGYGILKTTHHPDHALSGADRVAILKGGRIVADGLPGEVMSAELLSRLYGVDLTPFPLPDGRLVIAPAALGQPPIFP